MLYKVKDGVLMPATKDDAIDFVTDDVVHSNIAVRGINRDIILLESKNTGQVWAVDAKGIGP